MKATLLILIAILLPGCASTPAPLLRPGEQIVIESKPSQFDEFRTRKVSQGVVVRTERAPRVMTPLELVLRGRS